MPFTFSHPAIVLPLLKTRRKIFSATGLIAGSITPDFESFIKMGERKIYSHTWLGMFWFDLPLSVVICMVFHLIIRDPLIENLPTPLEERFSIYKNFNWLSYFRKNFLIVIISLLVGIFSHLIWDAFTHLNLHDPDSIRSRMRIGHMRLYIVLQYVCSLIGMLFILWVVYKLPRRKVKRVAASNMKFKYWLFVFLLAAFIGAYLYTDIHEETEMAAYMHVYVIDFIYMAISSSLLSLIVVSLLYTYVFRKKHLYIIK